MGNSETPVTDQKRRRSDQKRLESWKAIANYLNRSVRTVRRWEAHEGLPVHRHQHTKGYSVYAHCAELDAWRNKLHQPLQREPALLPEPRERPYFPALARYAAVAVVAGLVGGLVGKSVLQTTPVRNAPATSRDAWVLIAAPVNYSGLEEIGDNLRAALRREISQLASYRTLPQARIQRALRLMRQDSQAILSPAIAREVALRDGRVSALLIPRIEQLGGSYVLSVEISDPNNDLLVAYPSEKVDSLRSFLPMVERLVRDVEAGLVNRTSSTKPVSLPLVTTKSLSALRLYSRASKLLNDDRPTAAHELLGLAINEDAEFASALALQAWALRRGGASQETYLPVSRAAAEIKAQISPQERYFIEGSYRYFSGNPIRADANYRALLEMQPDHLIGTQAMLEICVRSSRAADCVDETVRVARLRSEHFESNMHAAWVLGTNTSYTKQAAYFANKSLELLQKGNGKFAPSSVARTLMFPVVTAWTQGDLQGALQKSRRLREDLPTLPIETRTLVIRNLVEFSLVLGRINDARNLLALLPDAAQRYELKAGILFASGDKEELKIHLTSGQKFKERMTAFLMSLSGLSEEAMALHNDLRLDGMSTAQGAVIIASVAIENDRMDSVKPELERAVTELTTRDRAFYFIGLDLLSVVLSAQGNLTEAISVLERSGPRRNDAIYHNAGRFWLICQRQLAQLYREADREYDATRIEKELRELLILADDDFPLLRSLSEA